MKNKGKVLSIFLGVMLALAGVFSQGILTQNSSSANASTAQNVSLSSVEGYSENGNTYNYIYFGEYPQTRVLTQETESETSTYGTYTAESVTAETTIKGFIKDLNETYYQSYLQDTTSAFHSMQNSSYVWSDETGTTTQIQNFYPQENYENTNISFNYRSGYYTLKTAVGTYAVGTKFHTYNQTVAYYEKMGSSYTYTTSTGTTGSGYVVSPTTLISAGSDYRSNIDNWLADPDATGTDTTYNKLRASKIYLFVVEPIKWKVLSNDGTNVTIVADTIIDSANFVNFNVYQTEWAFSDVRGWLNGTTTTSYSNSASATTTYTRKYDGRSFIDMAFSESQENAIATTTIAQDSSASYYAGAWHYYDQTSADLKSATVEARPTTTDKVFFLSQTELQGNYNSINENSYTGGTTEGGINRSSGTTYHTQSGFTSDSTRIAYNTDYSIATGNYDNALDGNNYSQNTTSGYGGIWWSRSASAYFSSGTRGVGIGGYVGNYYYSNDSLGVRPALRINLASFNLANCVSETSGDEASVASLGTSSAPIALTQSALSGTKTYALWSLSNEQSNATGSSGTWSVSAVIDNGDDTFKNKIKVTYADIKVGGTLYARVVNSSGGTEFLGAISPVITLGETGGETYFSFTTASADAVDDYSIEIYSAEGYTLYNCGVVELGSSGSRVKDTLDTVYLDPAGIFGGDDLNSGATTYAPVATVEMAKTLAKRGGTIIFMSVLIITEDTTLDFEDVEVTNTASCSSVFSIKNGAKLTVNDMDYTSTVGWLLFNIGLNYSSLVLNDCNVDIEQRIVIMGYFSTLTINGGDFTSNSNWAPISFNGSNKIIVNDAYFHNNVCGTGSIFAPDSLVYNSNIVSNTEITLNDCTFENNSGKLGAVVNLNAGSLTVNGGTYSGNTATVGGVFYINALGGANCPVSINGATFTDNSVSGYYVLPSATYDVKHSGSGADTDSANNLSGGGVIFCSQSLTIEDCLFDGNSANGTAAYAGGGAILIGGARASLNITNSGFIDNSSVRYGGALFVSTNGIKILQANLTDCKFTSNESTNAGGAIWFDYGGVQNAYTLRSCIFTSNESTTGIGGAISLMKGHADLYDCTFSDNSASLGGAIYVNGGTLSDADCAYYDNISTTGDEVYFASVSEPVFEFPEETTDNWTNFKATAFAGGTGTQASPYQIATAGQLAYLAYMVNTGSSWSSGKYFIQTADIDLSAHYWTPIGTYVDASGIFTTAFQGKFDGNDFSISGLYVNSSGKFVGLFGCAYGNACLIQNVTVLTGKVYSTNSYVGGVVGYSTSSSNVSNCSNFGTVSGTGNSVGGITGLNSSSSVVSNCSNSGTISGTNCVGGIVGLNDIHSTVSNCFNSGTVSGKSYVGGIVGQNYLSNVNNCSNSGTISGTGSVGGIVGFNNSSSVVSNCSNFGIVTGTSHIGGIVGFNQFSSTVGNCSNFGSVNGTGNNVGGIVGINYGNDAGTESAKCLVYNCYNTGTVTSAGTKGSIVGQNRGYSQVVNCYWLYDSTNSLGMATGIGSTTLNATDTGCSYFSQSGDLNSAVTISSVSYTTLSVLNAYVVANQTSPETLSFWTNFVAETVDGEVEYSYPQLVNLIGVGGDTTGETDVTYEFSTTTTGNWIDFKATAFAGGDGTQASPYQIATAGQLAYLAYMTNTGSSWSSGKYFIKTADIDLTAHYWTPIGTYVDASGIFTTAFQGRFDGNDFSISGLYINSSGKFAGLFGVAYGSACLIQNVTVLTGKVYSTSSHVGGIVGYNATYSTVSNCSNFGTVSGTSSVGGIVGYNATYSTVSNCLNFGRVSGTNYVGGIVGYNSTASNVSNCSNSGAISGTNQIGGIVGRNEANCTISNCSNSGTVSGTSNVGGIVGYNLSFSTVDNCSNSGTVSGTSQVGGIVGYNYASSTVSNCSNSGRISGTGERVGGIVGYNSTSSTVSNCSNSGTVSGTNYVGGIAGYNVTSSTVSNCSNSGTVSGTSCVGGILGYNHASSTVSNCSNSGTVSGTNYVGGIAGYNVTSSTVSNCSNSGTVSGTNSVGGIVGYNYGTDAGTESAKCFIYNCFNVGVVTSAGTKGAICGQNRGYSQIVNCYWLYDGTAGMSVGIGSTTLNATNTGCSYFNQSGELNTAVIINSVSYTTLSVLNAWVVLNQTTTLTYSLWTNIETKTIDDEVIYYYPQLVVLLTISGGSQTSAPTYDYPTATTGNWIDTGNVAVAFAGGTGTSADPYQIATAGQLAYLAYMTNTGSSWSSVKYFIQTADIDLTAHYWTPIGTYVLGSGDYTHAFKGVYNGNGKTINGLYIDSLDSSVGLFGCAYGNACLIKKVTILSGKIFSTSSYVGGIVGYNVLSSIVSNCSNSASVTGTSYVGGIAGVNSSTSIVRYSSNNGAVSGTSYIGGVVGQNFLYSTISNCSNFGIIDGKVNFGGIMGANSNHSTVGDCESGAISTSKPSILSSGTSLPVLTLTLDKTTFTEDEDITSLMSGYNMVDTDGQIVAGTFKAIGGTLAYTATTLVVRFYPTNANNYSSTYYTLLVNVKFSASAIYFALVNNVANFYLVASPTASSTIIAVTLQQAIDFLATDGIIYFSTPYIVSTALTLSVNGKNITFMRNSLTEMFNISSTGTLQIGTKTMSGNFVLNGNSLLGELALIVNAGTLKIYGNVVIQNAYNVNGTAGQGGAICNTGTADLDFMEIKSCRSHNLSGVGFGGAIYNSGTMNIANLKITSCLSTSGGAIYNIGTLNMTNCNLDSNKGWYFSASVYGCSIYNGGENSFLKMTDCKISNSNAVGSDGSTLVGTTISVYGGGIYVGAGASVQIYSSTISGCQALYGGGIYVAEGGTLSANDIAIQKCISNSSNGSALYTENADNVSLSDYSLVGNANSSGTVYAGTDGLFGGTGTFTLTGENLSYEMDIDNESDSSNIKSEQILAVLGILAVITVAVVFGIKSKRNRKKD